MTDRSDRLKRLWALTIIATGCAVGGTTASPRSGGAAQLQGGSLAKANGGVTSTNATGVARQGKTYIVRVPGQWSPAYARIFMSRGLLVPAVMSTKDGVVLVESASEDVLAELYTSHTILSYELDVDYHIPPDFVNDRLPPPTVVSSSPPSDPGFPRQWGVSKAGFTTAWGPPSAWGATTRVEPLVAFIDTGVDEGPEFLGLTMVQGQNVLSPRDSLRDVVGHGTSVLSVAFALGNNGHGIAGAAWQGRVSAFLAVEGRGSPRYGLVNAIYAAVGHGAQIINISVEVTGPQWASTLEQAVEHARQRGVVIVWAAGNRGEDLDAERRDRPGFFAYPSRFEGAARKGNVVTVAALSVAGDQLFEFSNRGAGTIDIAAPGEQIVCTSLGGRIVSASGTSFAAPFVTAGLALLWSRIGGPELERRQAILPEEDLGGDVDRLVETFLDIAKTSVPALEKAGVVAKGRVLWVGH